MDIITKEEFYEYLFNMQQAGKTGIQALVELAKMYNNENVTLEE